MYIFLCASVFRRTYTYVLDAWYGPCVIVPMLYSICIYMKLIVFNEEFYTKQKYLVLSETIYYVSVGLLSDLMSIACYI